MAQWNMLPPPGELVLCAVSGGADSMCLLDFLHRRGARVAAAHYNHRLRGAASDADQAFVEGWCAARGIPCAAGGGDVEREARRRGWTVEEAARNLRYAFLEETADTLGAARIALAHSANDNAETVLMHLVRGSGLRGLAGIPPARGRIVRPLLTTERGEIDAYLRRFDLPHVEDATNGDPRWTRNRFRRDLLPLLERENPSLVEALGRQAALLRREDALLDAMAAEGLRGVVETEGGLALPREAFRNAHGALGPRMVRLLLDRLGAGRRDLSAVHAQAAAELAAAGSRTGQVSLPGGLLARNQGDLFCLERRPEPPEERPLPLGEAVRWGRFLLCCEKKVAQGLPKAPCILLNYASLDGPVTVGPWRGGAGLDLGRGRRSLKRLFADRGVSPARRETMPVLYVAGRPAAALGLGTDQAFLPVPGGQVLAVTIEEMREETER